MNGLDLGWFFGVPNTWRNISLAKRKCGVESNAASNDNNGLEYFKQFPVSLSS
jgi:hypothetical protein